MPLHELAVTPTDVRDTGIAAGAQRARPLPAGHPSARPSRRRRTRTRHSRRLARRHRRARRFVVLRTDFVRRAGERHRAADARRGPRDMTYSRGSTASRRGRGSARSPVGFASSARPRPSWLGGSFPGDAAALTAHPAEPDGTGWRWETWHLYPKRHRRHRRSHRKPVAAVTRGRLVPDRRRTGRSRASGCLIGSVMDRPEHRVLPRRQLRLGGREPLPVHADRPTTSPTTSPRISRRKPARPTTRPTPSTCATTTTS